MHVGADAHIGPRTVRRPVPAVFKLVLTKIMRDVEDAVPYGWRSNSMRRRICGGVRFLKYKTPGRGEPLRRFVKEERSVWKKEE